MNLLCEQYNISLKKKNDHLTCIYLYFKASFVRFPSEKLARNFRENGWKCSTLPQLKSCFVNIRQYCEGERSKAKRWERIGIWYVINLLKKCSHCIISWAQLNLQVTLTSICAQLSYQRRNNLSQKVSQMRHNSAYKIFVLNFFIGQRKNTYIF